MSGYKRQQSYVNGDVILAEHSNMEFDQLADAFNKLTGHRHDGSEDEGPVLKLLADVDLDTKVVLDEDIDNDKITFYNRGVKSFEMTSDGFVIGNRFKLAYNSTTDSLDIGVV